MSGGIANKQKARQRQTTRTLSRDHRRGTGLDLEVLGWPRLVFPLEARVSCLGPRKLRRQCKRKKKAVSIEVGSMHPQRGHKMRLPPLKASTKTAENINCSPICNGEKAEGGSSKKYPKFHIYSECPTGN